MTRPNGKPCSRCGVNPKSGKQLCAECQSSCATCGKPTEKQSDRWRKYCGPCRRLAETQTYCTKCGGLRDGSHQSYCRSCYSAYSSAWDAANPDKVRDKLWRHDLKRTYGITPEQWHEMFEAQDRCCAVCKTPDPGGRGKFHVDHDHVTGKVRSLLCVNCNVALGQVKDSPEILRALAEYVERHAAAGVVMSS